MIGIEAAKNHQYRRESGFYERYMSGQGLDIGYQGLGSAQFEPVLPNARGFDLSTPDYDGLNLPLPDDSQDFIFSSHTLEHVEKHTETIQEWHRVLKIGGHMVLLLPHCFLYERAYKVGGSWGSCLDHKRLYTPSYLLCEIERSLIPNTYRIMSLRDVDTNFDYGVAHQIPPDYLGWSFEIELVLRKIQKPLWNVV